MSDIRQQILSYIQGLSPVSSHSHHLSDGALENFDLDALLRHTYVDWCGVTFDSTPQGRAAYLEKVRFKSYFIWVQRALQELYKLEGPLTPENWDSVSERIRACYRDPRFHLDILREKCGYRKVVVDTYWDPGSDNGHADLFTPTFRVDPFFCGLDHEARDHDGNSALRLYGELPQDLDGLMEYLRRLILQKKRQGCVALKCAIAYDRGLDFELVTREQAQKGLFGGSAAHRKAYQDYLFQKVCEFAAEAGLPLQVHTGMGQLSGARALSLKEAVSRNPDTKFVLFHCSYPWLGDVCALMHLYPNVYPDICWLPILSPTAARRILHELIEVGTADKVCWGCDTWTSEESYGAVLAMREVVSDVLAEKVDSGYFSLQDALCVADRLLVQNASRLYGI